MNKIIILMLLALFLVGCKTTDVGTVPTRGEFVIIDPDRVPVLDLNDVKWQVWNRERLATEAANSDNTDRVFYVLTPEQAEKLFSNLIRISDAFSKSVEVNHYYDKSIKEYREDVRQKREAESK